MTDNNKQVAHLFTMSTVRNVINKTPADLADGLTYAKGWRIGERSQRCRPNVDYMITIPQLAATRSN